MNDSENDFWKKRYDSLVAGVAAIEDQIRECVRQSQIMAAEKKQWEIEKIMQQGVIAQTLAAANATSNLYLEENRALKEEIKRLKGE